MLGLPTFLLVEAIFTYPTLCACILLGVDLQEFVIEIYISILTDTEIASSRRDGALFALRR
jgi:hypothetical protein